MLRDMILNCNTEVIVNKDFDLWVDGKKGKLVVKKLWHRQTGCFYFQVDICSKRLNVVDELCTLGFYMNKEGAFLIFDDESSIRVDYIQDFIVFLNSFKDNINYSLRRYIR